MFLSFGARISCLLLAIQAKEWTSVSFPDPLLQFRKCGNDARSPVCDPDGILSKEEKTLIEETVRPSETDAECSEREPLILVALARKIKIPKGVSKTKTQQDFAFNLAKKYKADLRCESDIILTIGVDNQQFFAVANRNSGVGANQISQFFKTTIPLFRKQNYADAITSIVGDIYEAKDQLKEIEALWSSRTFPNPLKEQERCENSRPIAVCDPDRMLSLLEKENLNMFVKSMEDESKKPDSSDSCEREGLQFIIALAESIQVPHGISNETAISRFAQDLQNQWGMKPQCHNLVVVTMSKENKQFYAAVNKKMGMKSKDLQSFFLKNLEKFQNENYKDGIAGVIWEVTRTYLDSKEPKKRT